MLQSVTSLTSSLLEHVDTAFSNFTPLNRLA